MGPVRPDGSDLSLTWRGRTWSPSEDAPQGPPLSTLESAGGRAPEVRVICGDALDVAHALRPELGGKVDLVYVDPPYASQTDYVLEARLDGPADGRVSRSVAYKDKWSKEKGGIGAYLDMLAPRLEAAARLLAPTGSLWVHLDWRAAYLVRVILDEMLGPGAFLNEIVWRRAPNLGRQAASSQFGRTLDTLVVYGAPSKNGTRTVLYPPTRLEPIQPSAIRWDVPESEGGRPFTTAPRGDYTDASIERLEAEGRIHRAASGKVYVKYFLVKNPDGEWCRERRVDALWTDIPPLRHAATTERTGFPTQKPRVLLERVIACATPEGGTVVDLYAGSGTAGEAAHALGRRAILGDVGAASIATARARLLRAGAALKIEQCGTAALPEGPAPEVRTREARGPSGEGGTHVELVSPREPLAWAIDTEYRANDGFRAIWHSERAPGARPVPCLREAIVPRGKGPLAVRVFGDDGAVSTTEATP
jgi:DNA modification methylase